MSEAGFHLFDATIGRCAIEWRGNRLTRVRLPAASEGRLRTAIICQNTEAREAAPPPFVAILRDKIIALCQGEPTGFHGAPLDRTGIEPLAARVYEALDDVPFGAVTTYGAIAEKLGDKSLARAIGAALGANPFPIIIPCHRVTASGGRMGGFSAPGGIETKRRLLEIEGAFAAAKLPLFGG